jgi:hypothetical protein
MPLAITTAFISDLVANDKLTFKTSAEAAVAFARAFSSYFGSVSAPPLIPGSNLLPLPVSNLTAALIPAFSAKDPASICLGIQLAVLAYMTPASTMFGPTAGAAASPVPLAATLVPAMSVVNPDSVSAKTTLATVLAVWLQTVTVTIGSAAVPLV